MKRRAGIALAALISCIPSTATSQTFPADSVITRIIESRSATNRNPAIVVGLIDGGTRRVIATGWADDAKSKRADGNTVFEIGSVSKTFTGTLLADMVRRGEVALTDPVSKYLPSQVKIPSRGDTVITLASLATQHSALPRMPSNFNPSNPDNPYADYTVAQMYEFLSGLSLTRAPGDQYEYSNLGMGLLGHALALRSGRTFESLLIDRVLKPLGMNDTRITLTPSMRARFAQGHSNAGYGVGPWDIPTLAGAGAIRSTVNDMLTYVAANLGQGPANVVSAMKDAQIARYEQSTKGPEIGLAWHATQRSGRRIVWHNGETGGYHSMVALDPAGGRGVVVLSNGAANIDDIAMHLIDSTIPLAKPKTLTLLKEIRLDAKKLAGLVGKYQLAPGAVFDVTQSDDVLFVQLTGQGRLRVFPSSENDFFLKVVDAQLTFTRDSTGRATDVTLHQGGRDQKAPRIQGS